MYLILQIILFFNKITSLGYLKSKYVERLFIGLLNLVKFLKYKLKTYF